MPKRRRQAHIPQGAPKKRRPVRRPEFQPEPEAQPEDEKPPMFADEVPVAVPLYGATGPVETRAHWMQQDQRRVGRRMEQLRRSSRELTTPRQASSGTLPGYDLAYIPHELRRIAITSAALTALVIVLAVVMR